jgi:hypothetical protein
VYEEYVVHVHVKKLECVEPSGHPYRQLTQPVLTHVESLEATGEVRGDAMKAIAG